MEENEQLSSDFIEKEDEMSIVLSDFDDFSIESLSDVSTMGDGSNRQRTSSLISEEYSEQNTAYHCRMFETTFLNTSKFPTYLRINVLRGVAKGVVTTKNIDKDELISYYVGERIYENSNLSGMDHYLEISSSITNTFWIDGSEEESGVAKYIGNVQENPNISVGWGMCADTYYPVFYALHDINAGDELVYSYEGQTQAYSWKTFRKNGLLVVSETILNCSKESPKIIQMEEDLAGCNEIVGKTDLEIRWFDSMLYIRTRLENITVFTNLCFEDIHETAFLDYLSDLKFYHKKFHEFVEELVNKKEIFFFKDFFDFRKHYIEFSEKVLESLYCVVQKNFDVLKVIFQDITRISSEVGFQMLEVRESNISTAINHYLIQVSKKCVSFLHSLESISLIIRKVDILKVAIFEIKNVIAGEVGHGVMKSDVLDFITPIIQATTKLIYTRQTTDLSVLKKTTSNAKNLVSELVKISARTASKKIHECAIRTASYYVTFLNSLITFRQKEDFDEKQLLSTLQSVFLTLPLLSKFVKELKENSRLLPVNSDGYKEKKLVKSNTVDISILNNTKQTISEDDGIPIKRNLNGDSWKEYPAKENNSADGFAIKRNLNVDNWKEYPADGRIIQATKRQKLGDNTTNTSTWVGNCFNNATPVIELSDNYVARVPPYNLDSDDIHKHSTSQNSSFNSEQIGTSNLCLTQKTSEDTEVASNGDTSQFENSLVNNERIMIDSTQQKTDIKNNESEFSPNRVDSLNSQNKIELKNIKLIIKQCTQVENTNSDKDKLMATFNTLTAEGKIEESTEKDNHIKGNELIVLENVESHTTDIDNIQANPDHVGEAKARINNNKKYLETLCGRNNSDIGKASQSRSHSYAINEKNAANFFKSIDTYNFIMNDYSKMEDLSNKVNLKHQELLFLSKLYKSFQLYYCPSDESSQTTFIEDMFEKDYELCYMKQCLLCVSLPQSLRRNRFLIVLFKFASLLKNMYMKAKDVERTCLLIKYKQFLNDNNKELLTIGKPEQKRNSLNGNLSIRLTRSSRQQRAGLRQTSVNSKSLNSYIQSTNEDWEVINEFAQNHYKKTGRQSISQVAFRKFFQENATLLKGFNLEKKIEQSRMKLATMRRKSKLQKSLGT